MKTNRKILTSLGFLLVIAVMVIQTSCQSTNTTKGGAIGAGAGAVIGGVIGHQSGNTAVGAIIGAAVGGSAGAIIGRQMDKQAEELKRDLKGATVQRVGEGILITFNTGLQFDFNSALLTLETKSNLKTLSSTLKKYEDTDIVVEGHTDSIGEPDYNHDLSERRAYSVEDYLATQGVGKKRFTVNGYGESQPLNGNETEAERQTNRRVEVAIYANNKMKKLAKKGELGVASR
jgi:outer membrane protein OmpA-like peptidoglycan-associated protein